MKEAYKYRTIRPYKIFIFGEISSIHCSLINNHPLHLIFHAEADKENISMPCFVMPHTEYQTTDYWVQDYCTFVGLNGLCKDISKTKLKKLPSKIV